MTNVIDDDALAEMRGWAAARRDRCAADPMMSVGVERYEPLTHALEELQRRRAGVMRVFTCTDHAGVWPVGVASIVVAPDEQAAREILAAELARHMLKPEPFTLTEVDLGTPSAIILRDGNY